MDRPHEPEELAEPVRTPPDQTPPAPPGVSQRDLVTASLLRCPKTS